MTVTVSNTGAMDGAAVVFVAYSVRVPGVLRYSRRIAAFARVHVSAGARTALDIPVRLRDLDRWDDALAANVVDPGEYNLEVGTCLSTAGVVSDVFPCTPLAGAVTIA